MKRIKGIPTIIGLLILMIGMVASVFLINRSTQLFTRASPTIIPKQVKFTNITENGFSVSWVTDETTSGFIKYGTANNLDQIAKDDRDDLSGQTSNFTTHHATLRNLNPITIYYFQIGSGGKLFDNNNQNYKITTAPALSAPSPPSDVAQGTVNSPSGAPANGAIVYLTLPGAITQSTLVKSSGNWLIPLNLARSENLSSYVQFDPEITVEDITVQGGNQGTATAIATTQNDSPIPTITLGKAHDFRTSALVSEETEKETTEASRFNLETTGSPPPILSEVTISNPEKEEQINAQRPEIKGEGPAGKALEIIIESPKTYTDTIIVDEDGNWTWTPPADLEPGEHTVTITYQDDEGEEKTLSQTFIILAAGSSDLPSLISTPSGTPVSSPSASPSASPRVSMPSTEEGVPEPGYLTPTFLVFIMGLIMISFGLFGNSLFKKKIT